MNSPILQTEQALVLQYIDENGEEDISNLVAELHIGRPRMAGLLQSLREAGLVVIRWSAYGAVVSLSAKGKRLVHQLWPESVLVA